MEQLPEDIKQKITDQIAKDNLIPFSTDIARKYSDFGYHLRDSEVEGLKEIIEFHIKATSEFEKGIQQQAATIKELLEGLEKLYALHNKNNVWMNPTTRKVEQLLNKHKP